MGDAKSPHYTHRNHKYNIN